MLQRPSLLAFAALFIACSPDLAPPGSGSLAPPHADPDDPTADPAERPDDPDEPDEPEDPTPPGPSVACNPGDPLATVGLRLCRDGASPGLTLLAPLPTRRTWLIDLDGRVVNEWTSAWTPGAATYLEPGGFLLRSGRGGPGLNPLLGNLPGSGGVIERFDWDGTLLQSVQISGPRHLAHHDFRSTPDGTLLAVVWEAVTREEAIALGRDPARVPAQGLLMDAVYEIDPESEEVVWAWRTRDHLVQSRDPSRSDYAEPGSRPERIDVDAGPLDHYDWTHVNGLDYDPTTDRIVLSVHGLDELWVIDHATSTEEAAGPDGDLLFRWGRPENWGGQGAQELWGQHDPTWLAPDRLLVFDNGLGRPGDFSRVLELRVPMAGEVPRLPTADDPPLPPDHVWTADDPTDLFASFVSGVQRLPEGGSLITDGPGGRFLEVDADGEPVWEYVSPAVAGRLLEAGERPEPLQNLLFKARRYAPDSPELAGLDLEPGEPLVRP